MTERAAMFLIVWSVAAGGDGGGGGGGGKTRPVVFLW